ncbi:MAG: hypothetical protein P8R54_28720 [Myxococcota bacterium]|nr:hypothetical protein [Myxococcota bacterium]
MKFDLTSITRKALALLAIGSAVAAWQGGAGAGIGFILGGLLLMVSFGAGWWLSRPSEDGSVPARNISGVAGLTAIKLPIIGGVAWLLFTNFPPVAVALGGMVFSFSISLDAWMNSRLPDFKSTANTAGNT